MHSSFFIFHYSLFFLTNPSHEINIFYSHFYLVPGFSPGFRPGEKKQAGSEARHTSDKKSRGN
jgi:hypothetical protein